MKILIILLLLLQVLFLSLFFAPTRTDSHEYAKAIVNQINTPTYNNWTNYIFYKSQMHETWKKELFIIITINLFNALLIAFVFYRIFHRRKISTKVKETQVYNDN